MDQAGTCNTHLNKKHKNISFTLDIGKNKKIPFCDINIFTCRVKFTFMALLQRYELQIFTHFIFILQSFGDLL